MKDVIYDTTYLQLQSLLIFANALGWVWDGRRLYKYLSTGKVKFAKFDNMQHMHNVNFIVRDGSKRYALSYPRGVITTHTIFENARKQRLVERTYLQYNKKLKRFTTQQWLVKHI